MNTLRQGLRRPAVAGAAICGLVLAVVLGMRAAGWMQRPELIVYDHLVRWRVQPEPLDPRIVICGMSESDLVRYGHPLDDERLAELLGKLSAAKPVVVGLDLYRDLPEPRSGEGQPRLAAALATLEQVIAIERLNSIPPPPALRDQPDRVAPNNLPADYAIDGLYRRAALFFEGGLPEPRESLALVLARTWLAAQAVEAGLVEGAEGAPLLKLGRTVFPRLTTEAGGYVRLDVRDYEMLIDYRGPRQFACVSFTDVLENRLPAGALAGKIVLVGVTAESVKDSNPTPIHPGLRGVVQHAMIVHQLLRAAVDGVRPTAWWPETAELGWIACWTLAGGALGASLRSPWKLAPAFFLLLGVLGFAAWKGLLAGWWIPAAAPALGAAMAATFNSSLVAFLERSDRTALHALFAKHVSSSVVSALWAERDQFLAGGRLKPQRLTATVLFTDLKGFSTTSEKMDPAVLLDWMNEYMSGMAREVERHGGMVNKYMGDAIMAVFGAPVGRSREDEFDRDALSAVECALGMRRLLAELNAGWQARGLPTTRMRVGIHTGDVVAGSIGSEERLEFTVLGDTVNTAARLESAGKEAIADTGLDCTILIGDSTCQRLHGRFNAQCLGPMNLKGKNDLVTVHSLPAEEPPDAAS